MPSWLVAAHVVRPGDQRDQVRRQRRRRRELPPAGCGLGGDGRVGGDRPLRRRGDAQRDRRLQIGLVEGGEDALRLVEEGHRVEVRLAVGRVDEAVDSLTGVRVRHLGLDVQGVPAVQAGQRQPVLVEPGNVEVAVVEADREQPGGLELDESLRAGHGREVDFGTGAEVRTVPGEVQVHQVRLDADRRTARDRLGTAKTRHPPILPDPRRIRRTPAPHPEAPPSPPGSPLGPGRGVVRTSGPGRRGSGPGRGGGVRG